MSADLVDDESVCRLYTPSMLAELLGAPVAAIRRWHRHGVLRAVRCVQRLPYFDFQEAAVARRLAQLLHAGCSLRLIDRRLAELARRAPHLERPLADPNVVIEGRRLYLRRGDELAEPGGQLLLDFDALPTHGDGGADESSVANSRAATIAMFPASPIALADAAERRDGESAAVTLSEQLQDEALEWEDEGRLDRAAECYRTLLMAAGPRAELQFALADVLYRAGDLPAARERYYAALELDEEYVEARASLGCVLAELGEVELAAATFEGALTYHADFADVHFHLAHALDRLGRGEQASAHYRTFLTLAPESPWAAAARDRLGIQLSVSGECLESL
jgi:tetratricopeptide (TPR) repeat protein